MKTETNEVLRVDGMTCESCVRHVTAALVRLEGVGNVRVDLRGGTVQFTTDGTTPLREVCEALEAEGYAAHVFAPTPVIVGP
jgi:copper chaperone